MHWRNEFSRGHAQTPEDTKQIMKSEHLYFKFRVYQFYIKYMEWTMPDTNIRKHFWSSDRIQYNWRTRKCRKLHFICDSFVHTTIHETFFATKCFVWHLLIHKHIHNPKMKYLLLLNVLFWICQSHTNKQ